MLVRFLQDYRGQLTGERFFRAGEVVALPDEKAQALVDAGRAEVAGADPLLGVEGVNEALLAELHALGIHSPEVLALADVKTLRRIKGVGQKTAERLIAAAEGK